MDRDELNAELMRLLRDVGRVGAQRFLAEVEHLLRRVEPERIDAVAWPETIGLRVSLPRPNVVGVHAGVAESTGTAFPATVVTATGTADLGFEATARGTVTTPSRPQVAPMLTLVVLVIVVALLELINTDVLHAPALREHLNVVLTLLTVPLSAYFTGGNRT